MPRLSGPSTNTIPGCTTAATSTRFVPDDPNVLNTIETGLDTADRQFLMAGGEMTGATDPAIVSGAYGSDSETVIRVTFKVGPNTGSLCTTTGNGPNASTNCGVILWFGAHVSC